MPERYDGGHMTAAAPPSHPHHTSALVLFSGGQDSTTCLAHALARFPRVETIGFDYGQRHSVELQARPVVLRELRQRFPAWAERLGEDHVLDLAVLGSVSHDALESALGRAGLQADASLGVAVPGRVMLRSDGSTDTLLDMPQVLTSWSRLYQLLLAAFPAERYLQGTAVTRVEEHADGVTVLDQPLFARGNVATAGGCLASSYLAGWVIARLAGVPSAARVSRWIASALPWPRKPHSPSASAKGKT